MREDFLEKVAHLEVVGVALVVVDVAARQRGLVQVSRKDAVAQGQLHLRGRLCRLEDHGARLAEDQARVLGERLPEVPGAERRSSSRRRRRRNRPRDVCAAVGLRGRRTLADMGTVVPGS
jgi:hypothetical protein